jgi:thiol:disulfide interchange protein DsbA
MRTGLLTAFLLSVTGSALAQEAEQANNRFQPGIHYQVINPAWDTGQDVPVVYEFFSYMCPGCYGFEPVMNELKTALTGGQQIVRIPVAFYPQWEPHAKTFYALEIMGEREKVHQSLFNAIHQQKKPLRDLPAIANWLSGAHGVDKEAFLQHANSFQVDSQMRKAKQMMTAMGVGRVPTLVIDGQYKPSFKQLGVAKDIIDLTVELAAVE